MPWRGPAYEGEVPSLGWYVLDWMAEHLIVPDGPSAGEPLVLTDEQATFVLSFYALDRRAEGPAIRGGKLVNARTTRRAVLSRPKGWGKSPILAALTLVEGLADVVFDGWDADGEPIGRPWSSLGFKPKVQIVAASEDQTANTWDPVLEMCREGPLGRSYAIEALDTFVNIPRGKIEYVTSAARSREGFRPVFAVMDQTESWVPSIGGPKLAAAIRRNLTKTGGSSIESPNAFVPGEDSVAEKSFEAYQLQIAGKLRNDTGILYDHREAPPETDPSDPESLREGLRVAYGDSVWVDLDRVMDDFYDPAAEESESRRYFLNQITSAADAWLAPHEWAARVNVERVVNDRAMIVLGFDGSRKRSHGTTDATALIGCTVADGHIFEVGVWEQPTGPAGRDWRVPTELVDAAVREAFRRWNVVGFYADPAKWEGYVAQWEAAFGPKLKVKATRLNPIEWWMTGGRALQIVRALEQFHSAVIDGEMTHDGTSTLARHVSNARRRESRSGIQIGKEHPDSPRKIDAAVAAVLAWQARLDAVAAGLSTKRTGFVPRRMN